LCSSRERKEERKNIFNCPAGTHFFLFLLLFLFLLFFLLILFVLLFLLFFVSRITCRRFQNCETYTALNVNWKDFEERESTPVFVR
jgi:predicted membrane protein